MSDTNMDFDVWEWLRKEKEAESRRAAPGRLAQQSLDGSDARRPPDGELEAVTGDAREAPPWRR